MVDGIAGGNGVGWFTECRVHNVGSGLPSPHFRCAVASCRYNVVVDIGGGNGQFLAALLSKHPQLRGVLVDQQAQVERGQQVRAEGTGEAIGSTFLVHADSLLRTEHAGSSGPPPVAATKVHKV